MERVLCPVYTNVCTGVHERWGVAPQTWTRDWTAQTTHEPGDQWLCRTPIKSRQHWRRTHLILRTSRSDIYVYIYTDYRFVQTMFQFRKNYHGNSRTVGIVNSQIQLNLPISVAKIKKKVLPVFLRNCISILLYMWRITWQKTAFKYQTIEFRVAMSNMTWRYSFPFKYLRHVVILTRYLISAGTHDVNLNFIKHKTELNRTDHWTKYATDVSHNDLSKLWKEMKISKRYYSLKE